MTLQELSDTAKSHGFTVPDNRLPRYRDCPQLEWSGWTLLIHDYPNDRVTWTLLTPSHTTESFGFSMEHLEHELAICTGKRVRT
jgi:hypothetical protein